MGDTPRSPTISMQLQQIAQQASDHPAMVFTTLAHRIDVAFLREAYRRVRKDAAAGLDSVTAKDYAEALEANLHSLHERLRSGCYHAPPVKRIWLEKADGSRRPIGIPVFEDKIVQRAVVMLMGAVYEEDFYGFSYGFRPGRNAHDALKALRTYCMTGRIGWIIDADISSYFDTIEHGALRAMIQQRINDGGLLRLIRVGKPGRAERRATFDFLGFTHYWGRSRRGRWIAGRKTSRKRLGRTLRQYWQWCRDHRHLPFKEQHRKLSRKLRGYYQYYGIRGNYKMLEVLYEAVERAWRYWLSRRGGKRRMS